MVFSKGNTCALPIARRCQPQVQLVLSVGGRHRDEEAAVELVAIDAEQLDLRGIVGRADVATCAAPAASGLDDHDVAGGRQSSPFALHTPDPPSDVEREIASRVLLGAEHRDSVSHGGELDLELRDQSLGVRVKHERMFPPGPDGTAVPRIHRPNVQKVA
jgi:hypothetical protein